MKELIVTGNAGGDAIKRTTPLGKEFINFSVAHYEGKTKDGQDIPATWVDVSLSSDSFLAQYVLNNVKKGVKVLVKGRNKINVYTTKQGQLAYSETIYADRIEVFNLETKTSEDTSPAESAQEEQQESVNDSAVN